MTRSSTPADVERRSHSYRLVLGAMVTSLVLAFVLALYIHQRFTTYTPRAVYHLPDQIESAVWLNVEQTIGFDVFKRAVLPAIEFERATPEPRLKHLERRTSLELDVDTREFLFARVNQTTWLAIVGGLYRRDKLKEGLVRLFEDESIPASLHGELVVTQSGHAFGLAKDGVLIVSNSQAVATQALGESSTGLDWKVLLHKPGTLMNLMSFSEAGHFAGVPVCKESGRRCWLSFEPGEPLHLHVERMAGAARSSDPGELPFEAAQWRAQSGAVGIMNFTATVELPAFWDAISAWQRELTDIVW